MINLFLFIHDYSGARSYANELLNYLSSTKSIILHKVFFMSTYYNEFKIIKEENTVEIHLPRVQNSNPNLDKYSNRCIDLMHSLLEGKDRIVFHLNMCNQVKLGIRAREKFGAKLIYTLHFLPYYFSYIHYENSNYEKIETTGDSLEKEMIAEADQIICVTRFAKEAICCQYNTPSSKVKAIHNGFSSTMNHSKARTETLIKLKKDFGFSQNETILLFAGVLEQRKGINFLIRAFLRIIDRFPNSRLVIAGNGNFYESLKIIDRKWAKITFTGKIGYSDLEKLYEISTIGIIPSIYEQCSYVALEMMKHGLPVVVAAAPGLRELYTNGENAVIVPLDKTDNERMQLEINEEKLADALNTILCDKSLRKKLSKNIRSDWKKLYTANHMGESTLSLYKKALFQKK